ncbi:acyl-CoA dehydrogenase [Actinoplanes sp. NPDC049802]|uniref:acyl-CoA dehydrogenase n=1 Tax=Actinoplanes sp. NPDC049802 TaxID=3154742 RepID=UPI0033EB2C1C
MRFELTEEQQLIRDSVKEFVQSEIAPLAAEIDRDHRPPLETIPKLAELGLLGMFVPTEYSGAGLDALSYVIAVEEIAKACATTAVMVEAHNSLAIWPILHYGTEEQKQAYLPGMATGETMGAFGLTEPGAGTDAAAQSSTAVPTEDGYLLNGQKVFITGAGYAKVFVVFARTSNEGPAHKGISAFIVDRDLPGFDIGEGERKLGIRASSTPPLMFSDVRLPKSALLGKEGQGFEIAMRTLDGGRTGIAAQALGIAEGALAAATDYAQQRVQFGRPISSMQAIQWMLADMATEIEAGRLLVYQAAWLESQGLPHATAGAMAKLFCAEMASRVAGKAIQVHGGNGYTEAYPVERFYRDAKITEIYEGTNEVQRILIAKSLLKSTRRA